MRRKTATALRYEGASTSRRRSWRPARVRSPSGSSTSPSEHGVPVHGGRRARGCAGQARARSGDPARALRRGGRGARLGLRPDEGRGHDRGPASAGWSAERPRSPGHYATAWKSGASASSAARSVFLSWPWIWQTRRLGDAEDLADLGQRQVLDVEQDGDLALALGQAGEGLAELVLGLLLGGLVQRVGRRVGRGDGVDALDRRLVVGEDERVQRGEVGLGDLVAALAQLGDAWCPSTRPARARSGGGRAAW